MSSSGWAMSRGSRHRGETQSAISQDRPITAGQSWSKLCRSRMVARPSALVAGTGLIVFLVVSSPRGRSRPRFLLVLARMLTLVIFFLGRLGGGGFFWLWWAGGGGVGGERCG